MTDVIGNKASKEAWQTQDYHRNAAAVVALAGGMVATDNGGDHE